MTDTGSDSLTGLLASIFAKADFDGDGALNAQVASTSSAAGADPAHSLRILVERARERIDSLSLISSNDHLDDLPTSSLRAVLLESINAQVLARTQTRPGDFTARKDVLQQSKNAYRAFLRQLVSLGIISRETSSSAYVSALYSNIQAVLQNDRSPFPEDAANRRAAKIASMKLERALIAALDEYRAAVRSKASVSGSVRSSNTGLDTGVNLANGVRPSDSVPNTAYDLLVLPQRAHQDETDEDEDEKESMVGSNAENGSGVRTPTSLRSYLIMLCQLHAVLALTALDSTYTEIQLLQSMPPEAELNARHAAAAAAEEERVRRQQRDGGQDDWRLDQRWGVANDSPILDKAGKPLRPFTILPGHGAGGQATGRMSGSTQDQMDARRRLQAQVFQPSHRLPTMTIDEYLAEEERRGNIIQGGGQASAERPTTKETLALQSEGQGVGTSRAEEADEEQRRKAIEWDEFAEANPKGIGNTMNRG